MVVLTGQGTIASAVECLKSGASDYLLKPADPEALEVALERALAGRALRREVQYLRAAGREAGIAPNPGYVDECRSTRATWPSRPATRPRC